MPSIISTQVTLFSPLREMAGLARKDGIKCLISSHSTSKQLLTWKSVFSQSLVFLQIVQLFRLLLKITIGQNVSFQDPGGVAWFVLRKRVSFRMVKIIFSAFFFFF